MDTSLDTNVDTSLDTHIDTHIDTNIDTHIDTHIDINIDTKMDTKTYCQYMEKLKDLCENDGKYTDFIRVSNNIIENSGNIHYFRWPNGETMLHWAAGGGNLDMCEYLVSYGAYINAKNIYGCTPLFYASLKKHFDVVEFLISLGGYFEAESEFSGGTVETPIPPYIGESNQEISKYVGDLISIKDKLEKLSEPFKLFYSEVINSRDSYEDSHINEPMIYGGKNKNNNRSWGLPENPDIPFLTDLAKKEETIIYIIKNIDQWCYKCLKTQTIYSKDERIDFKKCSSCKEVYYCSEECHKSHWKEHKKICKTKC